MTAADRPDPTPFLETAATGALMLAMAATPLATAKFTHNPYFLLALKWSVAAILILPAAAVLVIGSPSLGRARIGDGVFAAWFGLGVLATAGSEELGPAVTRLCEMTTVAAAYLVASRVSDRALIRSCFAVVLPVAAIVSAYSIAQHLGWNPLGLVAEGEDQFCATFVNRNLLAGFLAFAAVLGVEALSTASSSMARAAGTLAMTAIVAAGVLASTRGAWIGAGVALVLWAARPGRFRLSSALPLVLGVLLAAGVSQREKASLGVEGAGHARSARERKMMWRIGADLLRERPLLGWGPGGFDLASERKKAPYFREAENRATFQAPRFSHNDAIELSVEMGLPGTALWLGLMGALARRVRREWSSDGGAIALACVSVAIHGLFHWSLHDPVASLLFFAGMGATARCAPTADRLGAWVARGVKLAVAVAAALTLLHVTRVMAARTLFERGIAQQRAGQLHEALWTHRNAFSLDPEFAEALSQRAFVLSEMGFSYDALKLLDQARAIRPHDEAILFNMGMLHARRGSLASARQRFQAALEGNPNLADACFALAEVEEADGHRDRAKALRDEAAVILGARLRER